MEKRRMAGKRMRVGRLAFGVVALLLLVNVGCIWVAAGAAVGGGAAAGYAYLRGRLYRDFTTDQTRTVAAVHAAMTELQLPIVREEQGKDCTTIDTRTAD